MRVNVAHIPPLPELAKTKALGTTIFYNLKYNDAKYVKIKTDYTNKKAQFEVRSLFIHYAVTCNQ